MYENMLESLVVLHIEIPLTRCPISTHVPSIVRLQSLFHCDDHTYSQATYMSQKL